MTGQFIEIVHECEPPEILPSYGLRTKWLCDCEKEWIIFRSYYDGNKYWGFNQGQRWEPMKIEFDYKPSRWQRIIKKLKGKKK